MNLSIQTIFHRTKNDTQDELDIKNLSQEDVKSLRAIDPFMYYSIPGLRKASMHLQDIDHFNPEALCNPGVQRRSNASSRENKRPKRSTTVTRRTSISYEAHPDAIFDGLFEELVELERELEDLSEKEINSFDCCDPAVFKAILDEQ